MRISRRTLLASSCAFSVAGCTAPTTPNFAVLVDLSQTWHNPHDRVRNERLLASVGEALAKAAESASFARPTIRYHVIGADSLFRPALCVAVFEPRLLGAAGEDDPSLFHNSKRLRRYLKETCVFGALEAPGEPKTEITAALVTALRSMSPPQGADSAMRAQPSSGPRRVVVFSDLKEEPINTYNLSQEDFRGVDVLLVYRALPDDSGDIQLVQNRAQNWRRALEACGARAFSAPDTGVTAARLEPFFIQGRAV